MTPYAPPRSRHRGFTLVELLLVIVLGSVVVMGLYRVLAFQQRIYREEKETVAREEAVRLAASVLSADLMEATGEDFGAFGPDSLVIRSPVGFAVVCAVDSASRGLGLFGVRGRLSDVSGDSLLLYRDGGWVAYAIETVDPDDISLACPYDGGPDIQAAVRVSGPVTRVQVGAPVRAYHRYIYGLEPEADDYWLARSDGSSTELLAGPFHPDSGLSVSYLDASGDPTTDPAQLARVELSLVAKARGPSQEYDTLTVSVRPRNQ